MIRSLRSGGVDVQSSLSPELESHLSHQPQISATPANAVDSVHRPMGQVLIGVLKTANQLKHQWKDNFISSKFEWQIDTSLFDCYINPVLMAYIFCLFCVQSYS